MNEPELSIAQNHVCPECKDEGAIVVVADKVWCIRCGRIFSASEAVRGKPSKEAKRKACQAIEHHIDVQDYKAGRVPDLPTSVPTEWAEAYLKHTFGGRYSLNLEEWQTIRSVDMWHQEVYAKEVTRHRKRYDLPIGDEPFKPYPQYIPSGEGESQ